MKPELDLALLKFLIANKNNYNNYIDFVDKDVLSREANEILKTIKYLYTSTENLTLTYDTVCTVFLNHHQNLTPDQVILYKHLFSSLYENEYKESIQTILHSFKIKKLQAILEKNSSKISDIKKVVEELELVYDKSNTEEEELLHCPLGLDYALGHLKERASSGLGWYLKSLQRDLGNLIKGDFGIIAAYTNTGKTKFVISEGAYMASQLKEDKRLLYFNTEGRDDELITNIFCSVLGIAEPELDRDRAKYTDLYVSKMNGMLDRILVFPSAGKSLNFVRQMCEKFNAGLIIIDQLDHFSKDINSSPRPYQEIYQEVRQISIKYAPCLGVTQSSAPRKDRDGNTIWPRYLAVTDLHWSGVDKQSNCQFLITIGKIPSQPRTRYIWIPRSKLGPQEDPTKFECIFKYDINRYENSC